jgi:hypothetical protein
MQVESHPPQTLPATKPAELRIDLLRRHGHRTGLYAWAFGLVALLVVLIKLVVADTRQVKLSWVVGMLRLARLEYPRRPFSADSWASSRASSSVCGPGAGGRHRRAC